MSWLTLDKSNVKLTYDEQSKLWVDSIDKSNVKHSYDEKSKLWVDSL